jgi:hypothetical protein
MELEDGTIGRSVAVPDEVADRIEGLRQSYVTQHGREPTHIFEGAPHFELLEHWTVEAMKKGGVDPAMIYAFEKTNGLLLNERNENKVPDTDIAEWDAAIDEHERQTGRKASRRRLNDQDLDGILRHAPQENSPPRFVDRLPIRPPFTKNDWGARAVSDIVNDAECFGYLEDCLAEVERSGRAQVYLNMFMLMAHCGEPPAGEQN